MEKRLTVLLLSLALLVGCAPVLPETETTDGLHILCTTYPVYLLTTSITQSVDGVEVELLVNQQTSCLHDYTLTVKDMRAIERADVIVVNGVGLEGFMDAALNQSHAAVIDCSEPVVLLPLSGEDSHDHREHDYEKEYDPHYWMDPNRFALCLPYVANQLSALDASHEESYKNNLEQTLEEMGGGFLSEDLLQGVVARVSGQDRPLAALCSTPYLITFHDGFQYFADAFGLTILKSIEEEEGAEASAMELAEIIALVRDHHIPAIFVEKNGSRRSAQVIASETGCRVYELDLMMSGEGAGMEPYWNGIERNLNTVLEALE